MSTLQLVWKNIVRQLGSTLLSILLTAFGVAILCVIYITGDTFEKQLTNNSRNIDLVVGAKGSPLQLILSSLYHVDNPTGNIRLSQARMLAQNPFVETAVPISLGDNYKGHRLIGTEPAYLDLYGLKMADGQLWENPFEAVVGSETARKRGLKLGDEFHTAHGLSEDGYVHDEHPFRVVGVLEKSGTVADNLILCNLESVWDVHGLAHGESGKAEYEHEDHAHPPEGETFVKSIGADMLADRGEEVTAMLVRYSSPAAMGVVPRLVNESTDMQAASPAIESTRLFSLLGVGLDSLAILAYIIMAIAGLSVFISLYNALKDRKYDLAVMRALGASQIRLFGLVLAEGLAITGIGGILGLLMGHTALFFIGQQTSESADFIQVFALDINELWIILTACSIGIVAAILPAGKAYGTPISIILAEK